MLMNSLFYLRFRSPLVISGYVDIRHGHVVNRNWGDDINVYLLELISGRKVVMKNQSLFHKMKNTTSYLCIGSTVGFMVDESITVWGAGAMYPYRSLPAPPRNICSVRGPLTRKVFMDAGMSCPEIYGDPALLISRYYKPVVSKKHRLGIIAHYTDEDSPVLQDWLKKNPDVLLIRMGHYDRWEDIPDMVCSCEEIWSSSLHGLIVSDSYSVPNRWVKFNGRVVGGDFKYKDYLLSVGRGDEVAIHLETGKHMDELFASGHVEFNAAVEYDRILNSCPFLGNK